MPDVSIAVAWLAENRDLSIALAMTAIVVAAGRPLSGAGLAAMLWLLRRMNVDMPKVLKPALEDLVRTLLIAFAAVHLLRELELPETMGWLLEKTLYSAVLVHLFSGAYAAAATTVSAELPGYSTSDSRWLFSVLRIFLVILALVSLLKVWGVDIGAAFAGVGVLGAGIAIALQDFLRNMVAGLNNAGEQRFRSGDWIKAGEIEGTVERIHLRSTTVLGFDRVPRYVPNAMLAERVLENKSRIDRWRVSWTLPLVLEASDEQIAQVCDSLRANIEDCGDFVTDGSRPCIVLPAGLSESSVDVMIYVYARTRDWQEWLGVCSRLTLAMRASVAAAGTSVAYPTRTLHLDRPGSGSE